MRVLLLSFSGSGNTDFIARAIARRITAEGSECDQVRVEDIYLQRQTIDPNAYDRRILIYPVHAFGAPWIVHEALRILPAGNGASFAIIKSPGSTFIRGGSFALMRAELASCGWTTPYERTIVAPPNLGPIGDDTSLIVQLRAIRDTAYTTADEILADHPLHEDDNWFVRQWSIVINRFESTNARYKLGKRLTATAGCVGCGKCAKYCPSQNIIMADGKPTFGANCVICMRCIYGCPKNAIRITGALNKLITPDWSRIRRLQQIVEAE